MLLFNNDNYIIVDMVKFSVNKLHVLPLTSGERETGKAVHSGYDRNLFCACSIKL